MSDTGRIAAFYGAGKPKKPIPDPEPGAIVVRVTMANICGSDMHMWRGDVDLEGLGVSFPLVPGHEMVGKIYKLGDGVVMDAAGESLDEGDTVVFRYFYPCGRCRACLRGQTRACPFNLTVAAASCSEYPYFVGGMADYSTFIRRRRSSRCRTALMTDPPLGRTAPWRRSSRASQKRA